MGKIKPQKAQKLWTLQFFEDKCIALRSTLKILKIKDFSWSYDLLSTPALSCH
ncbi:hypothetical protein ACL0VS_17810 [Chryseobacterium sp. PMSZPI]|uniref:hypothetical protein n=1 Tax=Chryseobacterium sp. PMSZPI TaxID=1033900 RepID=UPI00399FD20C